MSAQAAARPAWAGTLDRTVLMSAAREEAELDDFGDSRFEEALEVFLQSVSTEGQLTDAGRVTVSLDIVRLLVNLLRHRADQLAHPEIAREDVSDPIVITGLPRTGTTKLQRVMACDEGFQSVPLWKILTPALLPGSAGQSPDPRIALAEQMSQMMYEAFPGAIAGHPMGPDEPEEEALLQQMTFQTRANALLYRVPSYLEWLDDQPLAYPYEYLREILQYLQWQDDGRRGRPWLLKSPMHLGCAEQLFDAFPDAMLIRCHREPVKVVPSLCKLMEEMRPSRGSTSEIDLEELGSDVLGFSVADWDRNMEMEPRLPGDQIIDVPYSAIAADIGAVIEEIYGRRGMTLPASAAARMGAWEQERPTGSYGHFEYTAAAYGLTADRIDTALADYRARFHELLPDRSAP